MSSVIQIKNLSKIYRLGEIGTGTISRDLERWYKMKVRGQEDPFLKIGQTNKTSEKGVSDIVYSLRDINLEVKQGEALGIIGMNGAGKSTLLKILSRVTSPSTGKINIKGRVASLLEVGTGFHPELTGRENIYLNGAILGMSKHEITRKLDEIIDFSGVERYVDTPVKRYSSGMYVRLAFAVAAHLESEILIVDEVLAVGDYEFQKKCLGKMGDISKGEGRTVLFVSHNMTAIQNLCLRSVLLENGKIIGDGLSKDVVKEYLVPKNKNVDLSSFRLPHKGQEIRFETSELAGGTNFIEYLQPITVEFVLKSHTNIDFENLSFGWGLVDAGGITICNSYSEFSFSLNAFSSKRVRLTMKETKHLMPGRYLTVLSVFNGPALVGEQLDAIWGYHTIDIVGIQVPKGYTYAHKWRQGWGSLLLDQQVEVIQEDESSSLKHSK